MKFFCDILFFMIGLFCQAQTQVKGFVYDAEKNGTIAGAFVFLYSQDNKLIENVSSSSDGTFTFSKTLNSGVYKIEITKFKYDKTTQNVLVAQNAQQILELNFYLLPKDNILEEMVINVERDILVKKDTIIYNIDSFRSEHDDSLEDVLNKINGIKVQGDGSIEVNGKTIQKVLIDGKETSDFGSGLITKSLSADKVKSVEVRFDEKNAKLKESLIDNEKFVILDIKLKTDVKKSFFGKQQIQAGYLDNFKIGGITNLFSLNEKYNVQFFAENNNFGRNNIKLSQIKNLGTESISKMMSLPVDYDDVKSRTTFSQELYGFDNFVQNDNSIVGLSVNLPLSAKTDLYIGSFNNYQFLENKFDRTLLFNDELLNSYIENNYNQEYNSKNKIQLKHTSEKVKLNSDINYVYSDQKINNYVIENADNIKFQKKHKSNNFYLNNNFEYLFSDKFAITSNLSFSTEKFDIHTDYQSSNLQNYNLFNLNDPFFQNNNNNQSKLSAEVKLSYKSGENGLHFLGYKYLLNQIKNEKTSNSLDFNSLDKIYKNNAQSLFYQTSYQFEKLYLNLLLEYCIVEFPNQNLDSYTQKTKEYFQYNFSGNYDFDMFTSINFSVSKQLEMFPLQKIISGNVLNDFQTVFTPSNTIQPYFNEVYNLTFSKTFSKRSNLSLAVLRSFSYNVNNQYLENNFIIQNSNQLKSNLFLFSSTFTTKLKNIPLSIVVEPEYMQNQSEFISNNNIENSKGKRLFGGLKLNYNVNKTYYFGYFFKYTHFIFENSLVPDVKNDFNFVTNNFNVETFFFEEKLKTQVNFKTVSFLKNKDNFNNFDFKIDYKNNKYKFFIQCNNIFNSKRFITKDISQNIVNTNVNQVFGRFINLGFEFKIN